jgi:hypothetical protein
MASVSRSSRAEFTWGLVLVGLGVLEAKVLQTNSPWAAPVALVIVGVLVDIAIFRVHILGRDVTRQSFRAWLGRWMS